MRDPAFWWTEISTAATLLAPAAAVYGAVAARRMRQPGWHAPVPVICVGNFTLGGGGKTPAAMAIAKLLFAAGHRPFFLSRGHGGQLCGPVRVMAHDANDVGDEPLLLARVAPTIVARNRPAGAIMAAQAGADVVVMDDGLQNPSLAKTLSIAVIDGRRGIGNGCVFPSGPLRAPLQAQMDHTHALLLVGPPTAAADRAVAAGRRRGTPLFRAELRAEPDAGAELAGKRVLAFAGIADPGKFFATLESCGVSAVIRMPFADHHRYSDTELRDLMARADRDRLALVTTEKDAVRLGRTPAAAELRSRVRTLPVTLQFQDEAAFHSLMIGAIRPAAAADPCNSVGETAHQPTAGPRYPSQSATDGSV